jgi:hypothetical protein
VARKSASGKKSAARKSPARKSAARKLAAAAGPATTGAMYGEGNWKADEEYRAGVRDFAESHDVEELAHEAADELEEEDEEIAPNEKAEPEEESEW